MGKDRDIIYYFFSRGDAGFSDFAYGSLGCLDTLLAPQGIPFLHNRHHTLMSRYHPIPFFFSPNIHHNPSNQAFPPPCTHPSTLVHPVLHVTPPSLTSAKPNVVRKTHKNTRSRGYVACISPLFFPSAMVPGLGRCSAAVLCGALRCGPHSGLSFGERIACVDGRDMVVGEKRKGSMFCWAC